MPTLTQVSDVNRRLVDPARLVAFKVLRDVSADGAYANLSLAIRRREENLTAQDAAFATQLANGAIRATGTLDAIIEAAGGRGLHTLQPAVVDALRLGAYQVLCLNVPGPVAVNTTVDLAAALIGERVAGVVNAVARRVCQLSWDGWLDTLTAGMDEVGALALRACHPRWVVDSLADVLPPDQLGDALAANNQPPRPTLAVRPGLLGRDELMAQTDGDATPYSPWGVVAPGDPGAIGAVADGRAGVQDEGSQLVVLATVLAAAGLDGPWLDMCAGPGGKAALLRGLSNRAFLIAAEAQPHRANLVAQALAGYPSGGHQVVAADGTRPAWQANHFGLVLIDAPCSGLGALRRRPDARWRHQPDDLDDLVKLQTGLLRSGLAAGRPGALVGYVTCSPHRKETVDVVVPIADQCGAEILDAPTYLGQVPNCAAITDPRFVQLWPHRHGTDAMFLALLRVTD